jgi:FixJ family two-component response regulator
VASTHDRAALEVKRISSRDVRIGRSFLRDGDVDGTACAVLDMRLPGMSGRDLQGRLSTREHPTSVVFVSAHNEPETQASVLRAGTVAFLKKPFDDTALIEAIEMAIRNSS